MAGNSVFGENVDKEKASELRRVDVDVARYEDDLLRGTVDDDEERIVDSGGRKLLDEVDGNRIPRTERNRKRFQQSVGTMPRLLVAFARNTGLNIVSDECPEIGPGIFSPDESQRSILTEMAGKDMVVEVPENGKS
jgi:hypothetical protein